MIEKPKVKCINCSRTIGAGHIREGEIEIICPKCGTTNIIGAKKKPEPQPYGDKVRLFTK